MTDVRNVAKAAPGSWRVCPSGRSVMSANVPHAADVRDIPAVPCNMDIYSNVRCVFMCIELQTFDFN